VTASCLRSVGAARRQLRLNGSCPSPAPTEPSHGTHSQSTAPSCTPAEAFDGDAHPTRRRTHVKRRSATPKPGTARRRTRTTREGRRGRLRQRPRSTHRPIVNRNDAVAHKGDLDPAKGARRSSGSRRAPPVVRSTQRPAPVHVNGANDQDRYEAGRMPDDLRPRGVARCDRSFGASSIGSKIGLANCRTSPTTAARPGRPF
jgi:hypothetical protein